MSFARQNYNTFDGNILQLLCQLSKNSNIKRRHVSVIKIHKSYDSFGINSMIGNKSVHSEHAVLREYFRKRKDMFWFCKTLDNIVNYFGSVISSKMLSDSYKSDTVLTYLNDIITNIPYKIPKYIYKNMKNLHVIITRWNPSDTLCSSKPCPVCLCMLKCLGIQKISYSLNEDIITDNIMNIVPYESYGLSKTIDISNNR